MKFILTLLIFCLICPSLHAEKLIVGTSPFNPPMEIQATKNNVFTGFEIDLVNEICRRINATCAYHPMTFEKIMKAVASGKVDLGIDGFFITRERLDQYLFSQPYLQTKAQLFARTDSNIDSTNINTGKRIGVEAGTVFRSLLLQMYSNVKVISYDNQPDMLKDLADNDIDLIMFDYIGASYWVNNSQGIFKLVGKAIPFGMGYGIMANLNQGQLISRINNALIAMQNDGTYLSIYSRYFGTA
ncbi:transporter substrate-binding domain-containing protein [Legionella micdadei]|uniref:Amino acid ABC transporter substrate-binding protein, PAAT family (TC 3.A.1.3.-) n=1 Tax=Legionella micdadei TaxID=451 RepID=A0A098GI22_LEGMI|nr:transporter substrate-binding domain-containing protein [Legionella micdadei]ARG98570.1 arginine ABC transporter substrate-binding protein [Legionella micdadei]ARH01314.1 arginine ABC transporter substrate-binding protein [Legionella micdadei]KTD27430.1 arginine ABC transporter substrate-binding protein [Legionella micdadei]NSL19360.1 transporter substrate-binding domain-containing protein [Legionella micdadei]CEG62138.1 Arginine 3rd transport system periplasmic binding protein [Legionella 